MRGPHLLLPLLLAAAPLGAQAADAPPPAAGAEADGCRIADIARLGRNPRPGELRCRYGVTGPGRFGLLNYLDVPVYQPATPLPGTHVVGVPGMPGPLPGESFERWEWRVHRTAYGPEVRRVERGMEPLDPVFLSRLLRFERTLRERGVRAHRRETYRPAERQAWVFQQGRSRPGPIATATLTSWHSRVDRNGRPAARAADYDVPARQMPLFHRTAEELGLLSYGEDSFDPGHVYLPDTDAASGLELAVLRLLPRVPHVTLETGRPSDESPTRERLARWRTEARAWAAAPWAPFPATEPAPARRPAVVLRAPSAQ